MSPRCGCHGITTLWVSRCHHVAGVTVRCHHIVGVTVSPRCECHHVAGVTVSPCCRCHGVTTLQVSRCHYVAGVMMSISNTVAGVMVSISNTGYWGGAIVTSQVASVLIESPLKISGTILLFSLCTLGNLLFILLLIPETKVSPQSLT